MYGVRYCKVFVLFGGSVMVVLATVCTAVGTHVLAAKVNAIQRILLCEIFRQIVVVDIVMSSLLGF